MAVPYVFFFLFLSSLQASLGLRETRDPPLCDSLEGEWMWNLTTTEGILEPCVNTDGVIPRWENFLWNVLRNKTSDVIEIIFTEEDFSPEEGTFVLKVGRGIKYEFPVGNDETVLYKFDGPVSENTSVYVENDDAWIHLTTSRATRPFKIFYFVIDASLLTQEFHVTGLNGTIEYREEDPVIQMPKRYVWHLSGPPGTGWDFQLQYLILNGGQNEFLYIGGGREVLSGRSGMILSNKEMQNKRSIRVATNDAVVYMVIPVRTTEWTGGFSLLFTRYGNETEMTTTTEEPSTSVLPIPSGDPPSITVLLRHPKRKLQNLTAHDAETWMYFQNLTKEIARACEDYAKENGLSSTSITYREIWMRITDCPRCFGDGNECMKTQIKVNASDDDGKYILRNDQLRAIIGGDPYKKWIEDAAAAKIDLNTECEYFPWWMFVGAGLTFIVIVAVLAWRCGIFQLLEKKHEEYEDTTKSDPTMKNNLPFQKMQPGIDDPGVYYQYEPESMGFSDPFDRQIQTQSFHDNPAFEADDVEVYRRESVPRRSSQTQSSSQPAYSPIASHHSSIMEPALTEL